MHNTAQELGRPRRLQAGRAGSVPRTLLHRSHGSDDLLELRLTGI